MSATILITLNSTTDIKSFRHKLQHEEISLHYTCSCICDLNGGSALRWVSRSYQCIHFNLNSSNQDSRMIRHQKFVKSDTLNSSYICNWIWTTKSFKRCSTKIVKGNLVKLSRKCSDLWVYLVRFESSGGCQKVEILLLGNVRYNQNEWSVQHMNRVGASWHRFPHLCTSTSYCEYCNEV